MAKKKKRGWAASFIVSLGLALPSLFQKPLPAWALIPGLCALAACVVYAAWDWIAKPSLSFAENMGRFAFMLFALACLLVPFGIWLYPESYLVVVETRFIGIPNRVTGFWSLVQDADGCSLYPATDVLFISITNLQSDRVLLSGYTVAVNGTPLTRLDLRHGDLVFMGNMGTMAQATCRRTVDFGSPAGVGSFLGFDHQKPDTEHACSLEGNFLDRELSGNYIAPKQTVRGWVFLQRTTPGAIPVLAEITLKDSTGKEFLYSINAEKGDPNADILPRKLQGLGVANVSMCSLK